MAPGNGQKGDAGRSRGSYRWWTHDRSTPPDDRYREWACPYCLGDNWACRAECQGCGLGRRVSAPLADSRNKQEMETWEREKQQQRRREEHQPRPAAHVDAARAQVLQHRAHAATRGSSSSPPTSRRAPSTSRAA